MHMLVRDLTPGKLACAGFNPNVDVKRSIYIHDGGNIGRTLSIAVPLNRNVRHHVICMRLRSNTGLRSIATRVGTSPCFTRSRARMFTMTSMSSMGSVNRNIGLIHGNMSNGARGRHFRFGVDVGGPTLATRMLIGITHTSFHLRPNYCAVPRVPIVSVLPNAHRRIITALIWSFRL